MSRVILTYANLTSLATIMSLLNCSFDALAQQSGSTWCNISRVIDDGDPLSATALLPVRPEHWNQARSDLSNTNLIAISASEAHRLSGLANSGGGAMHYLVRGSVFLSGQSSVRAAYDAAQEPRRFMLSVKSNGALVILSVASSSEPLTPVNVPMVIRVERTLTDSHLGCWAMS